MTGAFMGLTTAIFEKAAVAASCFFIVHSINRQFFVKLTAQSVFHHPDSCGRKEVNANGLWAIGVFIWALFMPYLRIFRRINRLFGEP